MSISTAQAETQTARKLRINPDRIMIDMEHEGVWLERELTIYDTTIDLNDLCKRICNNEFDITDITETSGSIIYQENGRSILIGEWYTSTAMMEINAESVEFRFKKVDDSEVSVSDVSTVALEFLNEQDFIDEDAKH